MKWGPLGTADARSFGQSGKLKAIRQLRSSRSELWPDVPTLTEQGVQGGVAPTTGNTTEAFADVIRRELTVLPKAAKDLGLKLN